MTVTAPASKIMNTLWQQPGAEARVVQLWTISKLSRNAVADIMAQEFGHRITGRGVEGHLERLGYKDGMRVLPDACPSAGAISLACGYAYTGMQVIRPDGTLSEARA